MYQKLRFYLGVSILLFVYSCSSPTGPFDGLYEGQLITKSTRISSIDTVVNIDTFAILLEIESNEFKRFFNNNNGNCKGLLNVAQSTLKFSSDECSCFCNCDPNVDCAGDFIIGEFENEFDGETLSLKQSIEQETDLGTSFYFKWIFEKEFILQRQ